MRTCATGDTFFLKQLIVFMPELNEIDHKTVFITDGKPGLKELIQDIFTNVEVSECTFHMKVNLMKRLGGHKDKKAILRVVWVPCCDKQHREVQSRNGGHQGYVRRCLQLLDKDTQCE